MAKQPRKKPKQRRSKEVVDSIFQASLRVLENANLDKLSTNKVAEVAGVSIGSLYQYFSDKESLLSEMLNQQAELNTKRLEELFDRNRELDLKSLIAVFTAEWVDHFMENQGYIKHFFEAYCRLQRTHELVALRLRLAKIVAFHLRQRFPELGSPEVLEKKAFVVLNMAMGLISLFCHLERTPYSVDELKRELTENTYRYLKSE